MRVKSLHLRQLLLSNERLWTVATNLSESWREEQYAYVRESNPDHKCPERVLSSDGLGFHIFVLKFQTIKYTAAETA